MTTHPTTHLRTTPRTLAACLCMFLLTLPACAQTETTTTSADIVHGSQYLTPLTADQLAAALTDAIDQHPTAKRTTVTLKVTDLETGEVLYDRNSDKLLTPASNLKIYTSAAALELLGPEYRWTTELLVRPQKLEKDKPSVLVIRGTGDPMFTHNDLFSLLEKACNEGLFNQVSNVIVSNDVFNVPLKGPGWMWDDEPDYYNMSVTSTMVDFNVMQLKRNSDEPTLKLDQTELNTEERKFLKEKRWIDSQQFKLSPESTYPNVFFHPSLVALEVPDIAIEKLRELERLGNDWTVTRFPFQDDVWAQHHVGPVDEDTGEQGEVVEITMHDPRLWIEGLARVWLHDKELMPAAVKDVDPAARNIMRMHMLTRQAAIDQGDDGEHLKPSAIHEGKTLAEAVKHFLKVSENAVGEMLLLKLSETFAPEGEVSWPAGAKVISDWLVNEAGLEDGSFRLVDGSGLSRYNLISADSSIRLLTYMKNTSEHFEPFFDGLPVYKLKPGKALDSDANEQGEATHFDGVPLAEFELERVFAKPGGMSGVSTISGYLKTYDGRWLAFSLLGNGYIGSSAPVRDLRDEVWAELARYRPAQ